MQIEGHLDILITLTVAIFAGIFFTILSRHLKVPVIVFLLGGAVALGPEGIGLITPNALGKFLPIIISLSVSIILFEGGLTLDVRGYRRCSSVIKRLLSIGAIVTWLGAALCIWLVFKPHYSLALLAGSLIIVTGPTVITPLLKRLKVNAHIHHILHWESVLIDPIGVFIALLCFEWVLGQSHGLAVAHFFLRTGAGLILGLSGGWLIYACMQHRLIPERMSNSFTLASALLLFGISEWIIPEAGLLSVTTAGFFVGIKSPPKLKEIRLFKAELADLLVGLLFLLLAARLEIAQFVQFGWAGLFLLLLIMLVVRPLNVFFSTLGSHLNWREKTFLSWIAPRGIVAASLASLFSMALIRAGDKNGAWLIEIFTYSVITATVILQGFSAYFVAWALKVNRKK